MLNPYHLLNYTNDFYDILPVYDLHIDTPIEGVLWFDFVCHCLAMLLKSVSDYTNKHFGNHYNPENA